MLGYSTASLGVSMVVALSNSAMPLFLGGYGLPNIVIGFLAQERSFIGGLIQPLVGALSDRTRTRFGRRKPFFFAGVPLTVAALLFLGSHPPVWAVLALLVVFAFFLAIANDPYLALMADITPSEQRGRMGSVMAVFSMAGQIALLGVAAVWWESQEFWVFLAVAVGLVVSFAVTFFAVQEPALGTDPAPASPASPLGYLRDVLRYRELAKYAGTQFFFWFGAGAAVPFLTRFAIETLGVGESTAFELVLVAVAATALVAAPVGVLADRVGKKPVLACGLALFSLNALVGSQAETVAHVAVTMALLGACNGVVLTLGYPLLTDLMPQDRKGEFTGLGSLVWSLAQPIGSTWAGFMVDATGSYRTVFIVAGVMIGLSFFGLLTVHPERVSPTPVASAGGKE